MSIDAARNTAAPTTDADSDLADASTALVRRWLEAAREVPASSSARMLAGVLADPAGLGFTVGFVDGVVRPEDTRVAAHRLAELAPSVPAFLPAPLRALVRLGGVLAPVLPGIVVPIARAVLRRMVAHLIVDARPAQLGRALRRIRRDGVRLNVNLLGEAVLGRGEADRRLDGTRALLARDDVDYVSIKVSSTVGPHSAWAFEEGVETIIERLRPLYALAAAAPTPKFINLDMEEYRDLDLTVAVFTRILDEEPFLHLEAGIVLQAYLPDALSAMQRLQAWAADRGARGGAPVKVRLVKGANLSMERVDAEVHGWPLATWTTKQDSDAHYKRVLDWALTPERTAHVRLGIAGHNLFDIAHSWLLATERGVTDRIEYEMLLGMAESQAAVVRRDVGELLLYTPVVRPSEFDVAIAYLIRRLEEGASSDNFMSAVFELDREPELFAREEQRFRRSLADAARLDVPASHRVQDRTAAFPPVAEGFENAADTDPAVAVNRDWGRAILARSTASEVGLAAIEAARIADAADVERVIATARAAAPGWWALGAAGRAAILHRAGDALEVARAELLEVMASEAGKTLDQGDPEVSEAIDFAHYYAERARELELIDGADAVQRPVTLVTPPWNFPVAIPAGSTLAALAAGSAVIIKPARATRRSGARMVEALWAGGVPREVLQLVQLDAPALGEQLVASAHVDQVILTGGYETAELFRGFRHAARVMGETSGKNAIIVTPSADLDLAVKDVVNSAFGHAGQKCSAASLVVLVGSVATSRRFRTQLVDAVRSLHVSLPDDPEAQVGPIIAAPTGKLASALTSVGPSESWLVEPEHLGAEGRLWRPGIRDGVRRGSEYHLTEYFGPILGIMTAETLDEAIDIVNEIEYGLTSGLHSLDADELRRWLARIEAGNLYINRGITGAIVQRQPFGGWKRAVVGAGFKAGGPNYLLGLVDWMPASASAGTSPLDGRAALVLHAARDPRSAIAHPQQDWLEVALANDARAWAEEFGVLRDRTGLVSERNVFRYLPQPAVEVRANEGASPVQLLRVLGAGASSGAGVAVSTSFDLPEPIAAALGELGIVARVEDHLAWERRIAAASASRIRLVGGGGERLTASTGGRPDITVFDGTVTQAGRIELLPFLREQAVSITAHRFGTPSALAHEALPEALG